MLAYNSTPTIIVQDNVLADDLCQYIIHLGQDKGPKISMINADGQEVRDEIRTSSSVGIDLGENDVIDKIYEMMSMMCHLPIENAEPMVVQRYLPGEEYRPHWDAFLDEEDLPASCLLEECGNRAVTVIGCLNDSDAGTVFPHLGIGIQSMQGRVIIFGNLDEEKDPHPLSMHLGSPPQEGEKWIYTIWFREKEFMRSSKPKKKSKQKNKVREFNEAKHAKSVLEKSKQIMQDRGSMPL